MCAHVHGFHPYIFVPVTPEFKKDYLAEFRRNMNQVNYLLGQLFLLGSFIKVIVADIKNNVDWGGVLLLLPVLHRGYGHLPLP